MELAFFNRCIKDWCELISFKVFSIYENDLIHTGLTTETLYVYTTENREFVSNVEILDDWVKSYKVEIKNAKKDSSKFETVHTTCKIPKYESEYEIFTIESKYLEGNDT